jgi:hypothetical protein
MAGTYHVATTRLNDSSQKISGLKRVAAVFGTPDALRQSVIHFSLQEDRRELHTEPDVR